MEKIFKNFPASLAIVSAYSLGLSIIYNVSFFMLIDDRLLTLMSMNDHLSAGVAFVAVFSIVYAVYCGFIYLFLQLSPKEKPFKLIHLLKDPLIIPPIVYLFILLLAWFIKGTDFFTIENEQLDNHIAGGIVCINLLMFYAFYKFDLFGFTIQRFIVSLFLSMITCLCVSAGVWQAVNVFYGKEEASIIKHDGRERHVYIVRILQHGLIFIENNKLVYRTDNEEIVIRDLGRDI